ncbi:MAG: efflux RND transporter periplasmic adaptor subunit [Sebaldella sp.]|nr:efflux RND transporter periplasmic adaptor subunit [Sebaldella sp.]
MKKICYLLLVLVFLISCGKKEVPEELATPVKVAELKSEVLPLYFSGNAEIKPVDEIPYTASVGGTLKAINFKNGDYVQQGQLVLSIDDQQSRSSQQAAASTYDIARIEYDKMRMLYEKRLITETDYLAAKSQYDSSRANLTATSDSVNRTLIKANLSGVVADLNLKQYQEVRPGDVLFTLVREDNMELEIGVPANVINNIHIGSKATIQVKEIGKEFEAFVSEVSPSADPTTRQFTIKVQIPNPNRELKKGMYGVANIDLGTSQGLMVPQTSIIIKGVSQVIFINENGIAKQIKVNVIAQNDQNAIVEGEGLTTGIQYLIDGQTSIESGEKIRIVE